jgi:hypothetical protein
MEGDEVKVVKGRKSKVKTEDKKVKKTSARAKVKKNKKGIIGAAIGAALGIVGTYFYMKSGEPKA